MAKGIKRRIKSALRRVRQEISASATSNPHGVAGVLASEGYAGGYCQALSDVQLLLNGVEPNNDRRYWTNYDLRSQSWYSKQSFGI